MRIVKIDLVGEEVQHRRVDFSQLVFDEPHTKDSHMTVEYTARSYDES